MHIKVSSPTSALKFQEGLPPVRVVVVGEKEDVHQEVPCLYRDRGLCVVQTGDCACGDNIYAIIHEATGTSLSAHIHRQLHVLVALQSLHAFAVDWTLSGDELEAALNAAPAHVRIFVTSLRSGRVAFGELPQRPQAQA